MTKVECPEEDCDEWVPSGMEYVLRDHLTDDHDYTLTEAENAVE